MANDEMDTTPPKTRQPKEEELSGDPLPSAEPAIEAEATKKPLSFYLSFLALNLMVFIISLDATALNVAIPVCWTTPVLVQKMSFKTNSCRRYRE
jgi:hypothetical protein